MTRYSFRPILTGLLLPAALLSAGLLVAGPAPAKPAVPVAVPVAGPAAVSAVVLTESSTDHRDDERSESDRFLRVDEEPGRRITLEIATRRYHPADDGEGPMIGLVSVAHIGERGFYHALQEELDGYDIVLYEVVAPDGARGGIHPDPEERAEATRQRMKLLAGMIERYREQRGRYPADLTVLREYVARENTVMANWVRAASVDAWGDPVNYETDDAGEFFRLKRDSGDDAEERLAISDGDGIDPLPLDEENIQGQLAAALGLSFQFDEVNYAAANWRMSDMTASMFTSALRDAGAEVDPAADMLMGTSFSARLAGFLLRMVRMLDRMTDGAIADMMKVFMIELLGDEALVEASMGQMGEAFADVLIDQRNRVVLDDLRRILETEPDVESIAVFYGAAHMDHFARKLQREFSYEPREVLWLPAMSVNLRESNIDPRQLQQIRMMLRRSVEQMAPRGEGQSNGVTK